MSGFRLSGALVFLSSGITFYQLSLMQVLSYAQGYHFAYMVVSLALLGFGASGTALFFLGKSLLRHEVSWLTFLCGAAGVGMPFAVWLSQAGALQFELEVAWVRPAEMGKLVLASLLFFLPFFCGALATGAVLTSRTERAGVLYCANLGGAGLGGLAGFLLAGALFPAQLAALSGIFPLGALLFLIPLLRGWKEWGMLTVAVVLVGYWIVRPVELQLAASKPLSQSLNIPGAELIESQPGLLGVVEAVASPVFREAPGLSLRYTGPVPEQVLIFVNGEAAGAAFAGEPVARAGHLAYTTDATAYIGLQVENVLSLGLEGGLPAWLALEQGASSVTVVEPNRSLVRLFSGEGSGGKVYRMGPGDGITLWHEDPRHFMRTDENHYDLIRFPVVGTPGGLTGFYALQEQNLLTVESLQAAWARLARNGRLVITSWIDYPERNPLRVMALLVELLESEGIGDPRAHLAAVRNWGAVTIWITKSPILEPEAEAIRAGASSLAFDLLLLPGLEEQERYAFHEPSDRTLFDAVDAILSPERRSFLRDYPFHLDAPTDSRPYFSQFFRIGKVREILAGMEGFRIPYFEMGTFLLAFTLVLLSTFAALFILLPLAWIPGRLGSGRAWVFGYFAALGAGFMLVEIVLMQQFHLLLGHPVRSAAVVLTGLLLSSGLGSLASSSVRSSPRGMVIAALFVAGLTFLLFLLISGLIDRVLAWPLFLRVATVLAAIAPIGFVMGFPFPLGLRRLGEEHPAALPWAWGINGSLSVVSPPVAILLAVHWGFGSVFLAGTAAYLVAAGAAFFSSHRTDAIARR